MTGLLARLRKPTGNASGETWRSVPRVNVLPRTGGGRSQKKLARYLLIGVIVLAGAFLALQWRQAGEDEAATERVRSELQQAQVSVAAEQQAVAELQAKVDAERQRVEAAKSAYEQMTGGKANLYTGMTALLAADVDGVDFETVDVTPAGDIALTGTAANIEAMSRFQAQLRAISGELKLQNISFESTSERLEFKANLKAAR